MTTSFLSLPFSPLLFSQPRTEERSGDDKGWFGPCRRLAGDGGAAARMGAPWPQESELSLSFTSFPLPIAAYSEHGAASNLGGQMKASAPPRCLSPVRAFARG